MQSVTQLLDYLGTQEEEVPTFNASNMILTVSSDASYLSKPKARSSTGGHYILSSNTQIPANNGAILNIAHIIKNVMSLGTEAELAALYHGKRSSLHQNHFGQNGTQATTNTDANQQRNGRCRYLR